MQLANLLRGQNYLSAVQCQHFFFKYTPPNGVPAQCMWGGECSQTDSMTRSRALSISFIIAPSVWTQCYRLGACLRDGSSSPEVTLVREAELSDVFSSPSNTFVREPAADHALAYSTLESGVHL